MKPHIALLLLILSLSSCTDSRNRLSPFRWPETTPNVDSATLKLEELYADFASCEKIAPVQQKLVDAIGVKNPSSRLQLRLEYWTIKWLQREGKREEALARIDSVMQCIDSINNKYEFFRLRGLQRILEGTTGSRRYGDLDEENRFYQKIDDQPMMATTFISLGTSLYQIGELERSLEYMHQADAINKRLGYGKMVVKNGINIANIHFQRGEDSIGRSLLMRLLQRPELHEDSSAQNLIKRNLYVHTGDVVWLKQAYADVAGSTSNRHLRGLYEGLLSQHFYDTQNIDSGRYYSHLAMNNIDAVSDFGHKANIVQTYVNTLEREGRTDSALYYAKLYVQYVDSDNNRMQQTEVLRMDNLRFVQLTELKANEKRSASRMIYMIVIFSMVMVAAVVIFIFNRRQSKQKIAHRDSLLEMEKGRRQLLAVMLAMEGKNNLFTSLSDDLERMRKEGTISASSADSLRNALQVHASGNEEWETFHDQFVKVNPNFVAKLKAQYPNLTDSNVRLATYIYMGLDNNKIARLLVIRPESVKQARWRLRRLMNLSSEESLNDTIRALG